MKFYSLIQEFGRGDVSLRWFNFEAKDFKAALIHLADELQPYEYMEDNGDDETIDYDRFIKEATDFTDAKTEAYVEQEEWGMFLSISEAKAALLYVNHQVEQGVR